MLRVSQNAAHAVARIVVAALAIVLVFAGVAVADDLDALATWADHITPPSWQAGSLYTAPTSVEDHFGRVPYELWKKRGQNGLGYPGLALPTAGAGSSWVFDSAHHIAAGTGYNDDGGWDDQISYAAAPPSKIAARDLSGVVSAHGLRLGMTPPQATSVFEVSTSAVRSLGAHYSALSVIKKCPVAKRCSEISAYYAVVVFRDGRATYIEMGIYGGGF
jgi:hypothetical protein